MQCTPVLPSLVPARGVWNGESQDGPARSLGLAWVWCRAVPHTALGETKGSFPEKALEKEPLIPSEKKSPMRMMCFICTPTRH